MRLWRTLLFAVIAIALGSYIWLVEKPRMEAESAPDKLLKFDPEHVSRVRLKYPESAIVLEKKEKDWRITEPVQADADDESATRLIAQIGETKAERRIASKDAEGLATYGLEGDGKQASVTMTLDDGTELPAIVIGNTTPVGYQAFTRVEGRDEIVVVPLILHSGIKKTVFDLREKKLFNIEPEHAISVTITREAGPIVLVREGERWKITSPVASEADADQVKTLTRSLNEMNALAYYEGDQVDREKFGLTNPAVEVQAEMSDKGTIGFRVGNRTTDSPPGYYVERMGDGVVAKVGEWVRNRFDQDLNGLRDKHLFQCAATDIGKVAYERADGSSFTLLKKDGKWTMEPAPERALKDAVVERNVGGLAALAGKEIVTDEADTPEELAGFALDVPVARVEIARADGSSCGAALAGAVGAESENPAYYLKRKDAPTVMSVPEYLYSRLDMKRDDFLEPAPPPASPPAPKQSEPSSQGAPAATSPPQQAPAAPVNP